MRYLVQAFVALGALILAPSVLEAPEKPEIRAISLSGSNPLPWLMPTRMRVAISTDWMPGRIFSFFCIRAGESIAVENS